MGQPVVLSTVTCVKRVRLALAQKMEGVVKRTSLPPRFLTRQTRIRGREESTANDASTEETFFLTSTPRHVVYDRHASRTGDNNPSAPLNKRSLEQLENVPLTEDGDLLGRASKCTNVFLDPVESETLCVNSVSEAQCCKGESANSLGLSSRGLAHQHRRLLDQREIQIQRDGSCESKVVRESLVLARRGAHLMEAKICVEVNVR